MAMGRDGARARRRARGHTSTRELMCWDAMAHGREARARGEGARRGREAARACTRRGRAGAPESLVVSANSKIVSTDGI
jgi:hypothetical protein